MHKTEQIHTNKDFYNCLWRHRFDKGRNSKKSIIIEKAYTAVILNKYSDRHACANSVDPDPQSSLIKIYTVCHSVCIFERINAILC